MIKDAILYLADKGVFLVLLPFLLLFTIIYAALLRVKVFEEKNVKLVIALTISLIVIILDFTTKKFGFIKFVGYVLPYTTLIIIGVFAWALLGGIFGMKPDWKILVAGLIILELIVPDTLLIALFLEKTGQKLPPGLNFLGAPGFKAALIGIAVFLFLIWYVTKD